jgi:hypothetical protein
VKLGFYLHDLRDVMGEHDRPVTAPIRVKDEHGHTIFELTINTDGPVPALQVRGVDVVIESRSVYGPAVVVIPHVSNTVSIRPERRIIPKGE